MLSQLQERETALWLLELNSLHSHPKLYEQSPGPPPAGWLILQNCHKGCRESSTSRPLWEYLHKVGGFLAL